MKLIQLFKDRSILWDPKHPKFKLTKINYDYWMDVFNKMNSDINEIKKKNYLIKPYLNRDHKLFIDNWCSSPSLAKYLHKKKRMLRVQFVKIVKECRP